MELGLKNKTIFIAGSSAGIGFAMAERFLQEKAKVVITGRDAGKLDKAYATLSERFPKDQILQYRADLSSEIEIKKALEACVSHLGGLDVAVANIGSGKEPPNLEFDENTLRASFDNNLLGSLLLTKQASLVMKEQKSGVILLISSIAGQEDIRAPIAYSAYKAALNAATKKFSRQLGPLGIRVNAIVPGNIYFSGGTWERRLQEDPDGIKNYIHQEVALRDFGKPEDVANLAVFLASEKANFITGSLMVVDGGQTRSF